MRDDEAKALVSRIADEIWNQGALEVCDEVMAPDARYHGPHMPEGEGTREVWKQAIGMYLSAFPDSHVVYEDLYSIGDTVVGRWTATATQSGPMPGVPATGKKIRISGITIYRLSGGIIVEAWEELDLLGMWRQLGVVELPGHGKTR